MTEPEWAQEVSLALDQPSHRFSELLSDGYAKLEFPKE